MQITGIGLGNASVGVWGTGAPVDQLLNTPIWFISGIFVLGYFIYYLLAKSEKSFVAFIAPLTILVFYASMYMAGDAVPLWNSAISLGGFHIATGFLNMFCGMSIGVLIWVACNNLKGKQWSKVMTAFMTICQIVLVFVVFVKSWVSAASPFGQFFSLGWGATYILTIFFSFFVLLNVDKCTRFPLFSSKIWKTPGRLSFYIYMLHFPIIIFTSMAMGFKGIVLTPDTAATVAPKVFLMYAVATVISIVMGFLVMLLDTKVVQPWMKSRPWYTKEQAAQEELAQGALK